MSHWARGMMENIMTESTLETVHCHLIPRRALQFEQKSSSTLQYFTRNRRVWSERYKKLISQPAACQRTNHGSEKRDGGREINKVKEEWKGRMAFRGRRRWRNGNKKHNFPNVRNIRMVTFGRCKSPAYSTAGEDVGFRAGGRKLTKLLWLHTVILLLLNPVTPAAKIMTLLRFTKCETSLHSERTVKLHPPSEVGEIFLITSPSSIFGGKQGDRSARQQTPRRNSETFSVLGGRFCIYYTSFWFYWLKENGLNYSAVSGGSEFEELDCG